MTTNQTIDGVPRDLLSRLLAWLNRANELNGDGDIAEYVELRALLDAPEPLWNPHPDAANLAALLIKLAQHGVKVKGGKGDEPWIVETAQPQGEPVGIQVGTSLRGQSFIRNCQVTCCGYCNGGCTIGSKP